MRITRLGGLNPVTDSLQNGETIDRLCIAEASIGLGDAVVPNPDADQTSAPITVESGNASAETGAVFGFYQGEVVNGSGGANTTLLGTDGSTVRLAGPVTVAGDLIWVRSSGFAWVAADGGTTDIVRGQALIINAAAPGMISSGAGLATGAKAVATALEAYTAATERAVACVVACM